MPLLQRAAERAVDLRKQWEKAAGIPDPRQRVIALWPFLDLFKYGVSFFKHTTSELQKASPAAGEYFAERFDEMSHNDKMMLLAGAGAYGSENLHQKLRTHLADQQHAYETFVASFGRVPKRGDWNAMPDNMKDVTGEIYYGLGGLAGFRDRDDLPFIRATAFWSAKYHLEQTAEAAVNAFRDMPDKENLPAIESVLKEFLPGRQPGMWSVDIDAERALCKHQYAESVPLLAPFVAEDFTSDETEECLSKIVGRDLGRSPRAWIDWYKAASSRPPQLQH
jgi:hypothetical protein